MQYPITVRKTKTETVDRDLRISFPIYSMTELHVGPQHVVITVYRTNFDGWRTLVTHSRAGDGSIAAYREGFSIESQHSRLVDLNDLFDDDFRPIRRTTADVFDAVMDKALAFIEADRRGQRPKPWPVGEGVEAMIPLAGKALHRRYGSGPPDAGDRSTFEPNQDTDLDGLERGQAPRAERP